MNFSDDSRELRELLERFFTDTVTSEYRRTRVHNPQAADAGFENQIAELGLVEYFSQSSEHLQIGDMSALSYHCGKHLVPAPFVEKILTHCLLPKIAPEVSPLVTEKNIGISFSRCCRLTGQGKKKRTLSGEILWATNCTNASSIIGMLDQGSSLQLVIIPIEQKGVSVTVQNSLDPTTILHSVRLDKASFTALSEPASVQFASILSCLKANEIAGACESVLAMTVDYVKTRKQFSRPIGSFQAVQQSIASAYVDYESIRSLSTFASWAGDNSAAQFYLTSLAAISAAAKHGPEICETAIQCHGGIGFTWEYDLHLFLRRVRLIASVFEISLQEARAMLNLARGLD